MGPRSLSGFLLLLAALPVLALDLGVVLHGLEGEQEKNVRAFLDIYREQDRDDLTEARVRYLHREAPGQIREALRPFGLFRPEIEASLERTGAGLLARYKVKPGPPLVLAEVDFRIDGPGRDQPPFDRPFPLNEGDPLSQSAYDEAKQSLLSEAVQKGYLDARYTRHEIRVDLDSYSATIALHLETGPHYRFGDVRFTGNVLDDDFLARYLEFQAGDPYSQDQLLSLQSTLIDSEYFQNVEVRPLRAEAEEGRVPVEVAVTPNKPNRYRAGIGYATDTGPRLTFDWLRRRFGTQGHRMSSELRLSQPNSRLEAGYFIPLDNPARDSLAFKIGAEHFDTSTRVGEQYAIGASRSRGLTRGWRRTLALDYAYEDFDVAEVPGKSKSLIPSITYDRLVSSGDGFDRSGHRLHVQLLGATEAVLSDSNFLQIHARGKLIHSLGDDWRVLTRLELGATLAEDVGDLPATKRFFAGGDNSVRGFRLDRLGPRGDTGEVVGGRYLAVGSLELERRVADQWGVAVFADVGNAFDPKLENELAYGAGFGVRWRSPVGPVRVDLANALSRDGNPWQLHLVVGPAL